MIRRAFPRWAPAALAVLALLRPATAAAQCNASGSANVCALIQATDEASGQQFLRDLERRVLEELNRSRRDPAAYAAFLEPMLSRFQGNRYVVRPNTYLDTAEGAPAVREAIAFLRQQPAVGPQSWSDELARAAADHTGDLGPRGEQGHQGTDGSTPDIRIRRYGRPRTSTGENLAYGSADPREIVIGLIVDDGIADRGHRMNVFNPSFQLVGVSCAPHASVLQIHCVIDYAGGLIAADAPRAVTVAGLLAEINRRRAERGLPALTLSERLSRVAADRAGGAAFGERIGRYGQLSGTASEVFLGGADTVAEIADALLVDGSPLMDAAFRVIGIDDRVPEGGAPETTLTLATSYQ